jgi:hypothetical protein
MERIPVNPRIHDVHNSFNPECRAEIGDLDDEINAKTEQKTL